MRYLPVFASFASFIPSLRFFSVASLPQRGRVKQYHNIGMEEFLLDSGGDGGSDGGGDGDGDGDGDLVGGGGQAWATVGGDRVGDGGRYDLVWCQWTLGHLTDPVEKTSM